MSFVFLHTADWHIGKAFGRFPADRAGVLRQARLDAIDRLAEAARAGGARHVLVAGDLYDAPGLADRALREPMARINRHQDLAWHVITGNHDANVAGGAWERVLRSGLPANVTLHVERRPAEIAGGVWLLPAGLKSKATSEDPTAWMDGAATPAGALRVGLAHGSTQGFGADHTASVGIDPGRAARAGLAYLALGDWHGAREAGVRAWYCGTPEPDGYLDNDPGCALIVRIGGAHEPQVERAAVARHRWLSRRLGPGRAIDLAALDGEIAELGGAAASVVLEAVLAGEVTLADDRRIRDWLDRLDAQVLHLDRRLERLRLAPASDDIDELPDALLRRIAVALAADIGEGGADAAVAERALRHLFALARAEAEGAP